MIPPLFSTELVRVCTCAQDVCQAVFDKIPPSEKDGYKAIPPPGFSLPKPGEKAIKFTDDDADHLQMLLSSFRATNDEVCQEKFAEKSGCTATVLYLKYNKLKVANVGDSKCVIFTEEWPGAEEWTPNPVTKDHKPKDEERKRIESMGGHVLDDEMRYGAARVFDVADPIAQMARNAEIRRKEAAEEARALTQSSGEGLGPDNQSGSGEIKTTTKSKYTGDRAVYREPWPGLAMSRCIGHTGVAAIGIVPDPDVKDVVMTKQDKCIVVASDGVWDFMTDKEVADLVKEYLPDAQTAAKMLIETASVRWMEDDPLYRDDISCLVIYTPVFGDVMQKIHHEMEKVVFNFEKLLLVEELEVEEEEVAPDLTASAEDQAKAKEAAAKKKKIKASKEQRRRSVVTKFG